jgi:hypothetical protein
MMENDQLSTGEEGLAIIQSMINKAKNQFGDNGHVYLLWGWVILLCSITEFIMIYYFNYKHHYMVWFLTWGTGIYHGIYAYRTKRKRIVKTYTDDILSYVWMVFLVLMLLFGLVFGMILGKDYYRIINPGFLALYGMPTFLSGIIIKFRPLIIGAVCCWILSITSALSTPVFHLLLLAAGVICGWIIPGYLMRVRYKRDSLMVK